MFTLKITNLKNGKVQQSDFQTQKECEDHFAKYDAENYWGEKERTNIIPSYVIHHEEVPAILDANGVEISPLVMTYDEIIPESSEIIPCEYKMEILSSLEAIAPISPRQIRLALLYSGITEDMVDTLINQLPSPDKEAAMIAWKYSTSFERSVPIVEQIGLALGFEGARLNMLWKAGELL